MNIQEHRKWYLDKLMECFSKNCVDDKNCPCLEHDGKKCYPLQYAMSPSLDEANKWNHYAVVTDFDTKQVVFAPLESIKQASKN